MIDERILQTARHLPMLSLEEMDLFGIMTTLCNDRQLLGLILECDLDKYFRCRLRARKGPKWEAVEARANELVSQICNSSFLKRRILGYLWPVSYRIMVWKNLYAPSMPSIFLQKFYWTRQGRIDNENTVKCIIGNNNITFRERFIFACSVCLSKEIREIWGKLSMEDKAYFLVRNGEEFSPLLLLWAHTMEGTENALQQFRDGGCDCAIHFGLLEAMKYIFSISAEHERNRMAYLCLTELDKKLVEIDSLEEDEIDIGYFLFFQMNIEDHKQAFNAFPKIVLSLLLQSGDYELCREFLTQRLSSTLGPDILLFLHTIFYTYHLEIVNHDDCRKLFIDLWRMLPGSLRDAISKDIFPVEFLCVLINDSFPFLFKKGSFKKTAELTSLGLTPCTSVEQFDFHPGKWRFLHFLIKEKVVTSLSLEVERQDIIFILDIKPSNKSKWSRIFRFVRKIENEIKK